MAGGLIYLGGGTPTQKACGIEDSTEDLFNYLMLAAGPNADPERVRLYAEGNLEHYEWLIRQGMEFKPEFYAGKNTNTPGDEGLIYSGNEACHGFREVARPTPRGHKGKVWGEGGGTMLMEKLIASVTEKGVRIRCDCRALTAILDDEGRVIGVVARIDGAERNIRARRGLVLCAGGFIMNTEMLERHAPQLLRDTYPNGNPNDNGSGIPSEYREAIFLPGRRLPGAHESGTGMGLAICRRIVERHHGEITARSAPNAGATFIITLPAQQAGKAASIQEE